MQLNFEYSQYVGDGRYPAAFHSPGNLCQVFYVDSDDRLKGMTSETPMGDWEARAFSSPWLLTTDQGVEYFKLHYTAGVGVYGVWFSEDRVEHRLGLFEYSTDYSKYLVSCIIRHYEDSPVSQLTLVLENPDQAVVSEFDGSMAATVGSQIILQFSSGSSPGYPMGVFYADSVGFSVGNPTVDIGARNSIGRLLVDQSFNEQNTFPIQLIHLNVEDLLEQAGLDNYWVSNSTYEVGMQFPDDMRLLDGLNEFLKTVLDWKVAEDASGAVGVGFRWDTRFDQAGEYEFLRGTDVWGRNVRRSGEGSYARVCVHTEDWASKVYRDVESHNEWGIPERKTMFVPIANETPLAEIEAVADSIAERVAQVGVIETFDGPLRPHIQIGDTVTIVREGGRADLLGRITALEHNFDARAGAITTFTVDSGGKVGRERLGDYINALTSRDRPSSEVKRLF